MRRSRSLHRPWTSAPDTPAKFVAWLERMAAPANHPFLVCRSDTDELVGVINLSNVVLGAFRSGYLRLLRLPATSGKASCAWACAPWCGTRSAR